MENDLDAAATGPANSTIAGSSEYARAARTQWIVWAITTLISLTIVALIIGAPVAQARGNVSFAHTIYQAFSFLCHQIPERSFHVAGYQFAVCSRCTGIYTGFAMAALSYPLITSLEHTRTPSRLWLILAAVPLAIDFALGYFNIWHNNHL